ERQADGVEAGRGRQVRRPARRGQQGGDQGRPLRRRGRGHPRDGPRRQERRRGPFAFPEVRQGQGGEGEGPEGEGPEGQEGQIELATEDRPPANWLARRPVCREVAGEPGGVALPSNFFPNRIKRQTGE